MDKNRFLEKDEVENFLGLISTLKNAKILGGNDVVKGSFATVMNDYWKRIFIEKWNLKESKKHPCLTQIIGDRCSGKNCMHVPGADHISLWERDGKPFMYVSQPYELFTDSLVQTVELCKEHNLKIMIDSKSWYFPTASILVCIYKKET